MEGEEIKYVEIGLYSEDQNPHTDAPAEHMVVEVDNAEMYAGRGFTVSPEEMKQAIENA